MEKKIRFYKNLNRLAIIIAMIHVILPLVFWKQIPDEIPTHYNAMGIADAWNYKSSIILIYFVVLFMAGMFGIVNYVLKCNAFSLNATESDKRNYHYCYPMMVISHLIIQIMFAYITFCSVTCKDLGSFFLPVVLVATFGSIIYYLFAYSKDASRSNEERLEKMKENDHIEFLEDVPGECFRTKIDWWLFLLLVGSLVLIAYFPIHGFITEGTIDFVTGITFILMLLIYIPMFRTRYILYANHLTVICFGKLRIPYKYISSMKETHNPLSSAALSLDRVQIDFINMKGGHDMVLVSPVRKKEFIRKIEEARITARLNDDTYKSGRTSE